MNFSVFRFILCITLYIVMRFADGRRVFCIRFLPKNSKNLYVMVDDWHFRVYIICTLCVITK